MRFLRNLSVAKKLALSAALAMTLLATLVALVMQQGGVAAHAQHEERAAVAARAHARTVALHVLGANNAWRGLLIAQDAEGIGREGAAIESEMAVAHDALAVEAADLMEARRITSVLVVDGEGRLCGALNSNDLMRAKVI